MGLFGREADEIDELHAATCLYTARDVVRSLLARSGWPAAGGRLLDPGCGDGAFLVEALADLGPRPGDDAAADRVVGWEIHPQACGQARRAYAATLVGMGWDVERARAAARRNVMEEDFVVGAREAGTFRHVVGNPPYLRAAHLPPGLRELYLSVVPRHAAGDLAHAFLDACAGLVEDEGTIAFVTADRWLVNQGTAGLREAIGARLGIAHLARLDPATTFHRPKDRRKGTPPRVHPVEVVLRTLGVVGLRRLDGAPVPPDGGPDDDHAGKRIGDVATVRLAPWLGPKGIFWMDQEEGRAIAGAELVPVIDTDDVDPATGTTREPTRVAIVTRRDVEPAAGVMEHLGRTMGAMPARGRGKVAWMPPEAMTLPINAPALLVPRILKGMRPVRIAAGLMPINHNLHVVGAGDASLDEIDGALRSETARAWLDRFAPRLEGGFMDVRAGILRRIPVGA